MQKIFRADSLFGISGLLSIPIAFYFYPSTLDIPIHDNYLVVSRIHISIVVSLIFFFFFLVYFSFLKSGRPLKNKLGFIHYLLSVLTLAFIFYVFTHSLSETPRRYYAMKADGFFDRHLDANDQVNIATVIFLFGQALFLLNIILTLTKRKNTA